MATQAKVGIWTWVLLGFVGLVVYGCFHDSGSSRKSTAETAEDKRKGFHCLSDWDGSHRGFASQVKRMMRDPDSFEIVETRVTPISADGTHTIFMQYRAKNGFGGMNVSNALGTFRNSDCVSTVLSFE